MVKEEVRVLVAESISDNLVVFIVFRGVKGMEHVGFVKGGLNELIDHLRRERLLDEIRYLVLSDEKVLEVRDGKLITSKLSDNDLKFISGIISEGRRIVKLILRELKPLIKL